MSIPHYRLPRSVEADPRAGDLLGELALRSSALWKDATHGAASLVPGSGVAAALVSAQQSGFVVRGLEAAERRLDEEERGLKLQPGQTTENSARISRLLLLTNDGAERFYRNVDGLLRRHGPRLVAIRFDIDEHALGEMLYGPGRVTRLVLLDHKNAVADLLIAVAEQWRAERQPA